LEEKDILDQKKQYMIDQYYDLLPATLKTMFFDVLILCHEDDMELADIYRNHLNDIALNNGRKLKAVILEDAELTSLSGSIFEKFEKAFRRSTFTFLFLTERFVKDSWSQFYTQTCLGESIEDMEKEWSVVPIFTVEKEIIKKMENTLSFKRLTGYDYGNHGRGKHHDEQVRKLVSDKCGVWKSRNDQLQQQRYEEALEIHMKNTK